MELNNQSFCVLYKEYFEAGISDIGNYVFCIFKYRILNNDNHLLFYI